MPEPASKNIMSDSLELCDTAVCVLHIQLIGTKVLLPKMNNDVFDVDSVFKVSGEMCVLKQFPICILRQYFSHDKSA